VVAAFTEMGPAWARWVQAAIPDDTVSYARLRVLNALICAQEGLTMTKLADALAVTGRRVTALVDALTEDGLVERYAHPTDGRSTIVEITEAGRAQQRQVWEEHQGRVAVAFGDLSDEDQLRLLDIDSARQRRRSCALSSPPTFWCELTCTWALDSCRVGAAECAPAAEGESCHGRSGDRRGRLPRRCRLSDGLAGDYWLGGGRRALGDGQAEGAHAENNGGADGSPGRFQAPPGCAHAARSAELC
jgi:DNA-binding MarR family transcriptional regulator